VNINKEQLINFIDQLARSTYEWNQCNADEDRGPSNNPTIIVIYDDASGVIASSIRGELRDLLNVQCEFSNAEEAANYLTVFHNALEKVE
jgi:hypothetical protein